MPRLGLIFLHLAIADGCNERRCCRQAADSICPPSARFFSGSSQHCLQYNPSAELIAGWPSSPNFTLEASFARLVRGKLTARRSATSMQPIGPLSDDHCRL
jgi:hypothetical protein